VGGAAPGPSGRRRPAAAVGAAPTPTAAVTGTGPPRVSAASGPARLAGDCAETAGCPPGGPRAAARDPRCAIRRSRSPARSPRGRRPRPRRPPDRPSPPLRPPTSIDGSPTCPEGLNHKLSASSKSYSPARDPSTRVLWKSSPLTTRRRERFAVPHARWDRCRGERSMPRRDDVRRRR